MNTITSNTTASANGQFGDLSEVTNGLNDVNQEDFFKLLTVELSSQDPLEPKKDSEFLSQVMQISSLEQARAMQSDLAAMRHEQQVIQANSMLGREVNFGETIDGKVSAVKFQDGRPMIEVDGQLIVIAVLDLQPDAGTASGQRPPHGATADDGRRNGGAAKQWRRQETCAGG